MPWRIIGFDAIFGDNHLVVPVAQIGHGVQNANVSANAHNDNLVRTFSFEISAQTGVVETAVSGFIADKPANIAELYQFINNVSFFGALNAVRREHLEFFIVRLMIIPQEHRHPALSIVNLPGE
jgi:hypothetical protein